MIAAVWLMLSGLLYALQLQTGSFPKPLTAEEERHYLALAAKGDLSARNVLIERNLRLVAHIMKKYYAQTADQEDLISIGTIGLIKGIESFDDSKGARLATYAARCVENAILTPATLRENGLHPKVSNSVSGTFWIDFRMICMFFPIYRILKCGMRLYSSIALCYVFLTSSNADMRKLIMYRTDSVGADTAGDSCRQRSRIRWGCPIMCTKRLRKVLPNVFQKKRQNGWHSSTTCR